MMVFISSYVFVFICRRTIIGKSRKTFFDHQYYSTWRYVFVFIGRKTIIGKNHIIFSIINITELGNKVRTCCHLCHALLTSIVFRSHVASPGRLDLLFLLMRLHMSL